MKQGTPHGVKKKREQQMVSNHERQACPFITSKNLNLDVKNDMQWRRLEMEGARIAEKE